MGDSPLWDVAIEISYVGDVELYGRLLLALHEPLDVTVGRFRIGQI